MVYTRNDDKILLGGGHNMVILLQGLHVKWMCVCVFTSYFGSSAYVQASYTLDSNVSLNFGDDVSIFSQH